MISTETRSDFGDWASPILVKELRQGMRSRIFMSAFYLTQLLMILCVVFGLTTVSDSGRGDGATFADGMFWFMISLPLLFMMPIRGFGALYEEIKTGTLELVFLTHLTAWRIAAGKWMAIMVQTLLLVCSVLPYVLLRYFLGGVDIIADIQNLFLLLLGSAVLTGMTVAISPYESKLLRALFMVALVFGFLTSFFSIMQLMASASRGATSTGPLAPWEFYVLLAAYVPPFLILSLEMAASRIAPPAENHALRKRLLGLYFLGIAPLMFLLGTTEGITASTLSALMLTLLVVDALGEPLAMVRSLHEPFLRHGAPGRLLSRFFVPGWASASWYTALVTAIAGAALFFGGFLAEESAMLVFVAVVGAVVFPAALIRLFLPTTQHFLGFYIALQFFFAAVTFLTSMASHFSEKSIIYVLCPLPTCSLILSLTRQVEEPMMSVFINITGLSTLAALAILLARSNTPLQKTRIMLEKPEQPHA